jgi:peptidyl-prolyl cis-trans isomerase C
MRPASPERTFLMIASLLTRGAAAALVTLALAAPVAAQDKAPDPVVADVNGEKIHLSDLVSTYRALPARLQQVPFEQLYKPLLEHAIAIRLLAAEGRKVKLQDTESVQKRLRYIEGQYVYEAYVEKIVGERATEAKLKEAYEAFVKDYKGEEEVRASHILVKSEQEAKDVIAQLEKGADFAKLAKEKSIDPSKDRNAGDLGFFSKEQMVKEFAEAAFGMKKGETSKTPVKTQFGWHVIRVTDSRAAAPPKFEEVKDQLRQKLAEGIAQEEITKLRGIAKIARFDAEGKPLAEEPKAEEKKEEKK